MLATSQLNNFMTKCQRGHFFQLFLFDLILCLLSSPLQSHVEELPYEVGLHPPDPVNLHKLGPFSLTYHFNLTLKTTKSYKFGKCSAHYPSVIFIFFSPKLSALVQVLEPVDDQRPRASLHLNVIVWAYLSNWRDQSTVGTATMVEDKNYCAFCS